MDHGSASRDSSARRFFVLSIPIKALIFSASPEVLSITRNSSFFVVSSLLRVNVIPSKAVINAFETVAFSTFEFPCCPCLDLAKEETSKALLSVPWSGEISHELLMAMTKRCDFDLNQKNYLTGWQSQEHGRGFLIWWIDLQSRLLKKLARHLQFLIIPLSRIYALIKGVASSNQAKSLFTECFAKLSQPRRKISKNSSEHSDLASPLHLLFEWGVILQSGCHRTVHPNALISCFQLL